MLGYVQLFWNPMDYSPPDFSVYQIFQVRILEWVANSFFRGVLTQGSNLHLLHCEFFTTETRGKSQSLSTLTSLVGWTNWICFQIEHWKGKISNFGVEKPGRHYLSQMIMVNLTGVINHWYHVTPDTMWWDIHQTHKLSLVMSETPDTRWKVFYNNWPVSSEAPGSWKTV